MKHGAGQDALGGGRRGFELGPCSFCQESGGGQGGRLGESEKGVGGVQLDQSRLGGQLSESVGVWGLTVILSQ